MITAEKLDSLEKVVEHFLRERPETRDNLDLLIALVEVHYNPELTSRGYYEVAANRGKYIKHSIESITRTVRNVRAKHADLRPSAPVQKKLKDNEGVCKEFFRNGQ